jgi:hypothetical protein
MFWEMMISFHSASKGVGGWVLPFFHFDQKLGKRHMGWRSLCSLNHELAKFAREESIRYLPRMRFEHYASWTVDDENRMSWIEACLLDLQVPPWGSHNAPRQDSTKSIHILVDLRKFRNLRWRCTKLRNEIYVYCVYDGAQYIEQNVTQYLNGLPRSLYKPLKAWQHTPRTKHCQPRK